MGARSAGSVFLGYILVLFPVTVQLSSPGCVTYKHRETCGLKGSSVQFSCSFPKHLQFISKSGWSTNVKNMKPKPLKYMPAYSLRIKYPKSGNTDCAMNLTDLKQSDASIYYFVYKFKNSTGYHTCKGFPGVRLHIFTSPVSILVEEHVRQQDVSDADWTVIEGQRIRLVCVPNCAANLNSNQGYVWYKNRLKLNDSNANSPFMCLDPISYVDTGSYVCAMIDYEDFPSSAVSLTVLRTHRNTMVSNEIPDVGSKNYSVPPLTHGCDAQNCQTPQGKSVFRFPIMLIASVSVMLVIAIILPIVLKIKKMKKRRRCAASVPGPPNPNSDSYMALNINSMSAEYDTLDTVRHCAAVDPVYENLLMPGNSTR